MVINELLNIFRLMFATLNYVKSQYSHLSHKHKGLDKRVGGKIFLRIIKEQDGINAQGGQF